MLRLIQRRQIGRPQIVLQQCRLGARLVAAGAMLQMIRLRLMMVVVAARRRRLIVRRLRQQRLRRRRLRGIVRTAADAAAVRMAIACRGCAAAAAAAAAAVAAGHLLQRHAQAGRPRGGRMRLVRQQMADVAGRASHLEPVRTVCMIIVGFSQLDKLRDRLWMGNSISFTTR